MAITDTAPMYRPYWVFGGTSAPSFTNVTTNADSEKYGAVLQAPKTGDIRKIHVRTGAAATPTDTDFRIETVDLATGFPSGSLWAANTNVTVASGSIAANTWITSGALTADASVVKGDFFAVVLAPAPTPNINWSTLTNFMDRQYAPYDLLFTGTWTRNNGGPVLAVEYSDGSFAYTPTVFPVQTINTRALNTGTTPDEAALKFTTTAPMRVTGAWTFMDADGDYDLVLYDTDGSTPLLTVSVDKELRRGFHGAMHLIFPSTATLSASSTYYLAVKPSSATTTNLMTFTVAATGLLTAMFGSTDHYATRSDAGAWTPTTTEVPLLGLIIDGIDAGGDGGGGSQRVIGG